MPIRPLWWYPACVAVHPSVVSVVVAGEEQQHFKRAQALAQYGTLVLGQEQDDLDGGFVSNQAFVGHVTGLTVWNYSLSPYQLQAWSKCEDVDGPEAYLSWDEINWTIHNDTGRIISHFDGPCRNNETSNKNLMLFTNKMSWPDAHQFLQLSGLSMVNLESTRERDQAKALILKYQYECTNVYSEGVHVWLGAVEHEMNNASGNESEINMKGKTRRTEYAISQDERGKLHKKDPFEQLCFIGLYEKMPQELHLQGFWGNRSLRKMSFILSPTPPDDHDNSVYLHGYNDYHIVRNNTKSSWCLEHSTESGGADTSVLACTMGKNPPLGRHLWKVFENNSWATVKSPVELSLSTCESDYFTCTDSSCVHLSKLCDNVLDCHDGADENNCFTCVKLTGYVQAIPPHIPVKLLVKMTITRIGSPDLLASSLNLDTTLNVAWTDPRLEFRHLHSTSQGSFTAVILEDESKVSQARKCYCSHSRATNSSVTERHNFFLCAVQVWMPAFKVEGGSLSQREVEDGLQVQRKTNGTVVDGGDILCR